MTETNFNENALIEAQSTSFQGFMNDIQQEELAEIVPQNEDEFGAIESIANQENSQIIDNPIAEIVTERVDGPPDHQT